MDRIHQLKTWPREFQAIREGAKTFEVRRNDRGFAEGDVLRLREYDPGAGVTPPNGQYTGRELRMRVIYILPGGQFGVEPGHVVMVITGAGDGH